jgi:glycosyltransferase involved in cell wall biosynthesis
MHQGRTISVVVPCYNEEEGIRHVLERMPSYVDEVVVVDNASTDRTAEVARSLGARVVHQAIRGYGAAYKAGLPAATGDVIATLDGDGTYPSDAIAGLVDHLVEKRLDFLSASRFPLSDPRAMSLTNRLGNWILTAATLLLFFRPIRDSQSGMWVFRREILRKLRLTSDGMALSEEIKIEALKHPEIRFGERHIDYRARIGDVKLRKWRDGFDNLWFLVRKRFSR